MLNAEGENDYTDAIKVVELAIALAKLRSQLNPGDFIDDIVDWVQRIDKQLNPDE